MEGEEGEVGEEIDATTEASAAAAIVMDETTKERCVGCVCVFVWRNVCSIL